MMLGRLLLRFLVVPLGAAVAIVVAALVVIVAHWNRFASLATVDAGGGEDMMIALFVAGSWTVMVVAVSAMAMLVPAAFGALVAEIFAFRSWWYHACNGALSAWIGLTSLVQAGEPYDFYGEPLIVVGAGIAAGFAYWLVAGWNAGFWKPVLAQPQASPFSSAPPEPLPPQPSTLPPAPQPGAPAA